MTAPHPTVSHRSEAELIAIIQSTLPAPPEWLVVGIGDDAAAVEPARHRLEVLTVDALLDGVHFDRRFTSPEAIGHRSLAVNLSDLASMGAEPRWALLSMALPGDYPLDDFTRLASGFSELAVRHRLHLVGGNLTRTPGPLAIDVTVAGSVKRRDVLRRSGARPGDEVYVSGSIGAAAAGLRMLRDGGAADEDCVARYLRPEPRVRLGMLLARNRAATACMDLSDGLADGVHQVARASGVGIRLDAAAIPVSAAARDRFSTGTLDASEAVLAALTGGDDYELLFTVRPRRRHRLRTVARQADIPITRIGVCTAEPQVRLQLADREVAVPPGYGHFR